MIHRLPPEKAIKQKILWIDWCFFELPTPDHADSQLYLLEAYQQNLKHGHIYEEQYSYFPWAPLIVIK